MENSLYNYFPEINEKSPHDNYFFSEREYLVGNDCEYFYQETQCRTNINDVTQCSLNRNPDKIEISNFPEAPAEYPSYRNIPKGVVTNDLKTFSYDDFDVKQRTDSDEIYKSPRLDSNKNHGDSNKLAKNKTPEVTYISSNTNSNENCPKRYFRNEWKTHPHSSKESEAKNKTPEGTNISSSTDSYENCPKRYFRNEWKTHPHSSEESVNSCDIQYESNCPLTFFPPDNYSVKKAKRERPPKPFTFITPLQSWKRVFEKYSPSTEIFHSPVKHIEANILPNVTLDEQLLGLVWVCGMSEQFYYDNSIILLQKYFTDPLKLKVIILMNSRNIDSDYFLKNMVDVNVLGSGSFGDVYRVKRKGTEEYFAVKHLTKTPAHYFYDHTESLMTYLKEKNFLLQARNSPYVVQFITSMKFPNINGLFLFFEWCLCDLRKYVRLVNWNKNFSIITDEIWYGQYNGIVEIFAKIFSQFEEDLYTVSVVYIFEIFCAIGFLADCNLVHQDLKPENIMISTTLHLKIGDFGLAYNTKFITRNSQLYFIKSSDINLSESSNYGPVWGGTPTYEDMELCYRYSAKTNPSAIRLIDNDKNNFPIKLMDKMQDANPNFLSDLWACGIMSLELLLGGLHFFRFENFSNKVIKKMKLTGMFQTDILKITYNKINNTIYVADGLRAFCGEDLEDLINFISSIFLPRPIRSMLYRKEKEVYRYKNKIKLASIDISKVEKINLFEKYGLLNYNAFLFNMPLGLKTLLRKPLQPEFNNLSHLLQNIMDNDDVNFYNIAPGIQGMFF